MDTTKQTLCCNRRKGCNELMKILHIIDSGGLYGAEVMLLNLMNEQAALGLEPVLASIGDPGRAEKAIEAEASRRGLQVAAFRMRPGPNIAGALEVLRFARREKCDLLHSHGYKGNIMFGFLPRWLRRMPMLATVHGWTWTGGMTRMAVYEWLDSLSLARMDRVVLVNEAMKNHPRLKNRPNLAVEVVANGIPDNYEADGDDSCAGLDREILDFCRQSYTIGAIGRLSPEKGFDLLLEAVAGLIAEGKDVQLLLLGEGGMRRRLEQRVQELALENRVLMPGYVHNARNYLPILQLFAMPSLTEGLPIVLLEAMQAGVPIVASAVGGIPDVLDNGRAGHLIEPGSVASLQHGISEVIRNPTAAGQRVQEAKQRVRNQYSSKTMAITYLELYEQAVQKTIPNFSTQQTQRTL